MNWFWTLAALTALAAIVCLLFDLLRPQTRDERLNQQGNPDDDQP